MRSRSPWLTGLALLALVAIGIWQLRHPASSPAAGPQDAGGSVASAPSATTPRTSPQAPASRRDLSVDEQHGGHTLERHVGRSLDDLRDRLRREPNISAASTYTDRVAAEETVAKTLAREGRRLDAWLGRSGARPNLALDYRGATGEAIGVSLQRGRREAVPCTDAVVVLRWDRDGYYVLTSYPEVRR